ncbi:MAG: hypothetical protein E7280_08580 [Lachnospiraceae bacterium]|nr:hypothetical protein [Lachnospiraceae bacterium]
MKKIKRGLSILLAVAMVLSGVMVPGEKAKADVQVQAAGTLHELTAVMVGDVPTAKVNNEVLNNDIVYGVEGGDVLRVAEAYRCEGTAVTYYTGTGFHGSGWTGIQSDDKVLEALEDSFNGCWKMSVIMTTQATEATEAKINQVYLHQIATAVVGDDSLNGNSIHILSGGKSADGKCYYVPRPGSRITLGALDDSFDGKPFSGWKYRFGDDDGPFTAAEKIEGGQYYRIPTAGHTETLHLQAQWGSNSTPIFYEEKVTRYPIRFNEASFRGTKTPEGVPTSYEPGEIVSLAGVTEEVKGFAFGGYRYSFGGGAKQEATKGADGTYSISTAGETGTLTIYAVWIPDSCDVTYDPNEAQLKTVNENAKLKEGEKAVTFEAQKKEDKIRKDGFVNEDKTIEMAGWSYDSKAEKPDITLKEAENMTVGEMMALYERNGGDTSQGKVTLYATWAYKKYKITYVGADYSDLEDTYTAKDQITLPDAKTMNERMALPKGSVTYGRRFTLWSTDPYSYKPVRTLGKDGDIKSGDVTLYAITVPEAVADYDMDRHWGEKFKKYSVLQDNPLNIYDKKSYALIYFISADVNADPDRITLDSPYYEIVPVDKTMTDYENGYACVAVRIKDSLKNSDLKAANKTNGRTLYFQVPALYDKEPQEVKYTLKVEKNYPVTPKTVTSKFKIYKELLPEKDPVVNFTANMKNSFFTAPYATGEWEFAFVDKNKDTGVGLEGITATLTEEKSINIAVDADKITKRVGGFVRVHNTDWIDGFYLYSNKIMIELGTAGNEKWDFSARTVILNNTVDGQKTEVKLIISGGMNLADTKLDPSKLNIREKKAFPEGLKAELKGDTITLTCEKGTAKKNYSLDISGEGIAKSYSLTVKVVNRAADDKAAIYKVYGKLDGEFGGRIYVKPTIKDFAGSIENAFIMNAADTCPFTVEWNKEIGMVELFTNKHFTPRTKKEKVTLAVTLSSGVVIYKEITVGFVKGTLKGTALNATIFTKRENLVKTPVILYYKGSVYNSLGKAKNKIRIFDLRNKDVSSLFTFGSPSAKKGLSVEYQDGEFVVKDGSGEIKDGEDAQIRMKVTLPATDRKCTLTCNVIVDRSTTP